MDMPSHDNPPELASGNILKHVSMSTRIHETVYTLESRVLSLPDGGTRSEYRVMLERNVIKDWTEGDVGQYFGMDIY
ncbi:hypothetical protein [Herbaspirillum seropedicae]|uniref:hypothetical protein n=1 Tax=Herbaspirillum seropedicae TaxID=964 RepID=UPI000847FF59|nr:hypothetical protein [Herbaspirillum seropedicae]AON53894.1 hypothetical protein Hsc_1594 [Herbaspirillum seropedicae]